MTVSTETASVSYSGNDSTTEFTVTFPFLANADIKATLRDSAGDETVWVETTDYTLTGAGGATGTLTATTAPATGETLTIERNMTFTQETDYVANDPFPAESHETALDKLTMISQQLNTDASLKVRFSSTVTDSPDLELNELAADRAAKIFQFNAAGDTLALASLTDGVSLASPGPIGASTPDAITGTTITANTGFTGDLTGGIVETGSSVVMNMKVVDIGDWDMNSDTTKSIAHGVADFTKIRSIQALIRNDADNLAVDFSSLNAGLDASVRWMTVGATNIILERATSGVFDNTSYDSTSYNRGWVTLWYTD
jgi:hypothetical protein